jgi:hypothetical protein
MSDGLKTIEIKNRWTDGIVIVGGCANIREAVEKNKANLSDANLSGANLSRANLSGADLYGANLSWAKGVNPHKTTPLLMLFDQPGPCRAYKLVQENSSSPMAQANGYTPFVYTLGATYREPGISFDANEQCAAGISLATLDWCMKEWRLGYHILIAEFAPTTNNLCVPICTDGKFRVGECTIVGEVDLVKIGLIEAEKTEAEQ